MVDLLIIIMALVFIVQACLGLHFLISSVWEHERRASFFSGLQFFAMLPLLVFYYYLFRIGFFQTTPGIVLLILALVFGASAAFIFIRRTAPNSKALKGTEGSIVGEVRRFDERAQVFARNRSIRPGSEQYQIFYGEHPELEEFDARRRENGLLHLHEGLPLESCQGIYP